MNIEQHTPEMKMNQSILFTAISILLLFAGCAMKVNNDNSSPVEVTIHSDTISSDRGELVNRDGKLIYTFTISDKYKAKVELDLDASVAHYSINGGDSRFGGVGLPVTCYNDFEYANYQIFSRDVNGDGYQDIIIANEQGGVLVEEASCFDPLKVQFEEQDHFNRFESDMKNTQGFVVLDVANSNFDGDEEFILRNEDKTAWLSVYCRNICNISEYLNTKGERKQYVTWLRDFNPWLYLYGERQRIVFRYLKEDKNSYTVIVNEDAGETKRLQKIKGLDIFSIEEYLKANVISFDTEKQLLRSKPNKDADIIPIRDEASGEFDVAEIIGDWLHVIDRVDKTTNGWIRWRVGDKLAVTPYYYYE